jgi:xyloglucan-specific exo-beta-1,4-glucanase
MWLRSALRGGELMRRLIAAVILAISLHPADAILLRGSVSIARPSFTPAWQALSIGGGGLHNNIQVSPSDGTMVTSSNTYGAYLYKTTGTCDGSANGGWGTSRSAPCWEQLFTQTSAPLTLTQVALLNQGVLEIDSCNSDTNTAYAFYNGNLWVTANLKASAASRTWAQTTRTTTIAGNQGVSAGTHSVIACDPNNPNIVYSSNLSNVSASANGKSGASATFTTVSGVTAGTSVANLIVYDGSSGATVGTCAQFSGSPSCTLHFLIFKNGTGVYETYDGGNTFTLTSGGPTTSQVACVNFCFALKADQFGYFWAGIGDTHLYKYVPNGSAGGGTWSTVTPLSNNNQYGQFALDSTSSTAGTLRIVAAYASGNMSVSTDGGSTWCRASANQPFAASGLQPGWLGNANQNQGTTNNLFLTLADLGFDTSGNLRGVAGIGVWKIASASVTCGATWQADSLGIETLVSNHVEAPPGNNPCMAVWDRGFFCGNPDTFPSHYYPDESYFPTTRGVQAGWSFDYASSTTNFLTGWVNTQNTQPGSSSDGGNTWSIWGSLVLGTTNFGGDVAASTPSNWIVVPAGNSGNLRFTTNGGASFAASTITGLTSPISANNQHGFHLAADRVIANTFCLVDNGPNLWASTNSGATFTKTSAVIRAIKYNDALKAVPGQAGVFYYSAGNAGGGSKNLKLYKITKTTNECDTATVVNANIGNIFGMGFGAPLPSGNGFPTIYFYGAVRGVQGLYEIDNGGTTATLISAPASAQTWPNNSSDYINEVSGDINVYGRVYVGHNGSGFTYIDTQNACPWVNFDQVSVKPGSALTGTVTLTANHSGLVPVTGVNFYVDGVQIGSTQTGQSSYSVSFNASAQTPASHTLTVSATGNGCNTYKANTNSFSIPVTTS